MNDHADSIWLHGKGLEVSQVWLTTTDEHRIEAEYEQVLESGVARVALAEPIAPGNATLHFVYQAPFNTSSFALFKAIRGADSYAVTQFEPIAARQAFPGFDEPVFKVPFDLAVISQAGDVTITTTPEVSSETLEDGYVKHSFARTRPLPTYLLAFAVGPYDLVDFGMMPPNSIRDREVALRGVAARGLGGRMQYALENTASLGSSIDPEASEWRVPVCVNYVADGTQRSTCAMLNESKQTIALDSTTCPSQLHPNADGAGYYRFSMDETWWNGLIADTSALVPSEALVMSDSLDAAFRAGKVSANTYVSGMVALVNNGAWDVADSVLTQLEQITTIELTKAFEAVE